MKNLITSVTLALALLAAGCGDKHGKPTSSGGTPAPSGTLPAELLATTAPADAKDILALKKDAKEGDEVVLRGVVGGKEDPFVANRGTVWLIDVSVPSCKDNEGDGCKTPWDYCCVPAEELDAAKVTVQVNDAKGDLLKVGLNAGGKIKPYDVLIVRGKVAPREGGNLVVNATSIYVQGAKN